MTFKHTVISEQWLLEYSAVLIPRGTDTFLLLMLYFVLSSPIIIWL